MPKNNMRKNLETISGSDEQVLCVDSERCMVMDAWRAGDTVKREIRERWKSDSGQKKCRLCDEEPPWFMCNPGTGVENE